MKTYPLTSEDKELIELAKFVIDKNKCKNEKFASSVGCALMAKSGTVYLGTNIKMKKSSPCSIDAEMSAVAQMFSSGGREIKSVVSVRFPKSKDGDWHIWQPCGACRHVLNQFGNPWVIISKSKKVRLSSLYPMPL